MFEDTTKHYPIDSMATSGSQNRSRIKGGHWRFRNLAKVNYEIDLILQHFYNRLSFDKICKIAYPNSTSFDVMNSKNNSQKT